jgi:hypothetical protein
MMMLDVGIRTVTLINFILLLLVEFSAIAGKTVNDVSNDGMDSADFIASESVPVMNLEAVVATDIKAKDHGTPMIDLDKGASSLFVLQEIYSQHVVLQGRKG